MSRTPSKLEELSGSRLGRAWQNLRAIEAFVAFAQTGSMTAAANQLGLTQSAVSQSLATLEAAFERQLFDRSVRPPRLTMAGCVLAAKSAPMLDKIREVADAMNADLDGHVPLLRIGIVNSLAGLVGPRVFGALADVALRLSVGSGTNETSVQAVLDRKVDLAVSSDRPELDELYSVPIIEEPYVLAVPRGMVDAAPSIEQLRQNSDFIRYQKNSFIGRDIDIYLRSRHLDLPNRHEFDSTGPVLAMVNTRQGWAITTPLAALLSLPFAGDVAFHPIPDGPTPRTLRVMAPNSHSAGLARRVADITRSAILELHGEKLKEIAPWWDWARA